MSTEKNMSACDDEYWGEKVLVTVFGQPKPSGETTDKFDKNMGEYGFGNADLDYLCLKDTFENAKHVKVKTIINRKRSYEIEEYIENNKKYAKYDKFVFVFMTFKGEEDGLIHVRDTQQYQVDRTFNAMNKNQDLVGKPKVILIQADDLTLTPIKEDELHDKGGRKMRKVRIPSDVDRLVISSSIPQNYNDDREVPSIMIKAFCTVVKDNAGSEEDLFSLTTNMNNKVKEYIEEMKQKRAENADKLELPIVFSSLTKFLKLM